MFKKLFSGRLLMFVFLFAVISSAKVQAASISDIYSLAGGGFGETVIKSQTIGGERTMVLPSSVKVESVTLYSKTSASGVYIEGVLKKEPFESGKTINLNEFCKEWDYKLTFKTSGGTIGKIRFLFSDNIPAVFLISDNPSQRGRKWVEASPSKSNKATGKIVMIKEDGSAVHSGVLTQIKGRGNSTWGRSKKPYQIKTADKVDLLETGNSENKSKTWLLLANAMDPTVMNNAIALRLGKEAGMKSYIESTHVDLYYDGEYRGNYLLTEKVEVGSGRVDVEDMEDKNEEANAGVNIESLPIKKATTSNGAVYRYMGGMKSPADITGGYLIEMDFAERLAPEICYFKTKRGKYVVVKNPEYASKEEMNYIATLYQEYEDALYNGGVNPYTGKHYSEYIDVDSVAGYYAVGEFTIGKDFFKSSAYLYKNAGEDKLTMGPLWDYDLSFHSAGLLDKVFYPPNSEGVFSTDFSKKLLERDDFCAAMNNIYKNKLYPYMLAELFNDADGNKVEGSLLYEADRLRSSAGINAMMWHPQRTWDEYFADLNKFVRERSYYVYEMFGRYDKSVPVYVPDYVEGFTDVLEEDWFAESVKEVKNRNLMSGTSESSFSPYNHVTRAETAQVIYNIAGDSRTIFDSSFIDVSSDAWYRVPVLWASDTGVITGFLDRTFRPDVQITREELVVALYRFENRPEADASLDAFNDAEIISPYAETAMKWAVSVNIINGDNNGNLNPKGTLKRAELATILCRYINNK